jgi:hypothetical protein
MDLDLGPVITGARLIVVNLIVRIVGYYTLQFCDYFMCGPIGRRKIFLTSSLLVEIEGHFSFEFVNYVCETEDYGQTTLPLS